MTPLSDLKSLSNIQQNIRDHSRHSHFWRMRTAIFILLSNVKHISYLSLPLLSFVSIFWLFFGFRLRYLCFVVGCTHLSSRLVRHSSCIPMEIDDRLIAVKCSSSLWNAGHYLTLFHWVSLGVPQIFSTPTRIADIMSSTSSRYIVQ